MPKICEMDGVREYAEGLPIELWLVDGRLAVLAKNEGGHAGTFVDLRDLIDWLQSGCNREAQDVGSADLTITLPGF